MKKGFLVMIVGLMSIVINSVYAACSPGDTPPADGYQCVNGNWQTDAGMPYFDTTSLGANSNANATNSASNQNTNQKSPCLKYMNKTSWQENVAVLAQCQTCANDKNQTTCIQNKRTKSFSCESLFTKHEDARVCNRNRCIAEKGLENNKGNEIGDNSCNCKYGVQGVGATGIPLNTSIPFVGRCVPKSSGSTDDGSALNAFPVIISAATKMLVTVILLVSFVMIVVGGVQWASGDAKSGKAKITKVAIGIAMLGMMGAILRLINPNFFK